MKKTIFITTALPNGKSVSILHDNHTLPSPWIVETKDKTNIVATFECKWLLGSKQAFQYYNKEVKALFKEFCRM